MAILFLILHLLFGRERFLNRSLIKHPNIAARLPQLPTVRILKFLHKYQSLLIEEQDELERKIFIDTGILISKICKIKVTSQKHLAIM